MQRGSACDFGPPSVFITGEECPFAKQKLEHQEESVGNRSRRSFICIAFVLASALSLLAQDDLQLKAGDPAPLPLTAKLVEAPVMGDVNHGSELPDAPSASQPDTSTADPAASPVVKRESQGARPAAMGGPMGVDRSVADRNYWAVTGGMFSASILNAELTMHCLQQHASCNDVPSSLRSRTALYGIGIPADLGVAYLTYYMKRKHNRMWYVPAAAVTVANIYFGIRAYRWSQD
jgi:hypothetical protein